MIHLLTRTIRMGLVFLGLTAAAVAFARQPANPVVAENQRPGNTDWLLKRTQVDDNQRSRAIEGYCSHLSVRAGQTLTVYVSTNPAVRYRCDIYRMGYYGGKGARRVHSVGPLEGATQPEPKTADRLLRYCRWSSSFKITIPEDWLSGVYLGKLSAVRKGPQSYIIFIVRDDRRADLLFQCSDFTWQAYNRWPAWSSLYDYEGNRWETKRSNDIGFDRPYSRYYNELPVSLDKATPLVGSAEFLLWEFPLAYWLEREGYDVTYISNLDTHQDRQGLLRAKVFLSIGHDEYWTRRMFDNVAAARDAGVNLAFLSGNSVDGQIRLQPGPGGRPDRVFARNGHFEDEAELMGASSYGVGLTDWTCSAADHWLFEGTGMKPGDAIPGLVGWEYHGPPLKDDSTLVVLARGRVKDGGGGVLDGEYAAVLYEGPRGNLVFNAATCWYSLPLSSPPGFVNPNHGDFRAEDPRVQRITHSLLKRMIAR